MPEAENTSWTQSNVTATKPVIEVMEIKDDKVTDSNIQEDKKVGILTSLCCIVLHGVMIILQFIDQL